MWGLNWGKGAGTGTEAGLVDKACAMGLAPPIRSAITWGVGDREGESTMCLVPDKAPLVHLGHQVPRPLHVPRE